MAQDGKKLVRYLEACGYRIRDFNIVYLEGLDAETWEQNGDRQGSFNDVRVVVRKSGEILMSVYATTEPGTYWIQNPMNRQGAARIAFGQHKDAWCIGLHKGTPALVQCSNVRVHRDSNKDGTRIGDPVDVGLFGINQHGTRAGWSSDEVGRWSAGCLVGKYWDSHIKFVNLCKSTGYKTFDTTILDGDKFLREAE